MKRFLQITLLLCSMLFTTVEVGAWKFTSDPASGEVESLNFIKLTHNQGANCEYSVSLDITGPNGTETISFTGMDNDCIYASKTGITTPGTYTLTIPANKVHPIVGYVNIFDPVPGEGNEAQTITWTIKESQGGGGNNNNNNNNNTPQGTWTFLSVSPNQGEVTSLKDFTFRIGSGNGINGSKPLTIKNENNDEWTLYITDDFHGNAVGSLQNQITTPGTYTLNIPDSYIDNYSLQPNAEMTYTWTIPGPTGPAYTSTDPIQFAAYNTAGWWATYSNTKDAFIEQTAKVYTVKIENDNIIMEPIEDAEYVETVADINNTTGTFVPANTGVLLFVEQENAKDYAAPSVSAWTVDNADKFPYTNLNYLYPSSKPMEEVNAAYYKLAYDYYNDKTGLGFYWGAPDGGAFTSKEGAAYLAVPSGIKARSFYLFNDSETTGINNVNENVNENLNVYNLAGQRVAASQKGIMIINGKKVIK